MRFCLEGNQKIQEIKLLIINGHLKGLQVHLIGLLCKEATKFTERSVQDVIP